MISNGNAPGVGFNDPTPTAPVGGNPGTTLGQQRLNAFQAAANIWGAQLNSAVPIVVLATLDRSGRNDTSAVLGSAGPTGFSLNFPGAARAGTLYHLALANALVGLDINRRGQREIRARFNSNLGTPGCLTGIPFYLGLDNNHGTAIDLVTVLLHEFGHGLGFSTATDSSTGAQFAGFPSAYDHFLFDTTQNLSWVDMSNAQRAASAINPRRLVWTGLNVVDAVPTVLQRGAPRLDILAPASVAGSHLVGTATFGLPLGPGGLSGEVMPVVDQPSGTGVACAPLNPANALAVNGRIALIDRGPCPFVTQTKNVQNAGAIAAIIVDSVAGSPPPDMTGTDPSIIIPVVRVTLADGNSLKSALQFRSRTRSGVMARLDLDMASFKGADAQGRAAALYAKPCPAGIVRLSLGSERCSESADGAVHQCRPAPHSDAAAGSDLHAAEGRGLEPVVRSTSAFGRTPASRMRSRS